MREQVISISNPKVMQSAAGYYIGTTCDTKMIYDNGMYDIMANAPYDRESNYFPTEAEAELYLSATA
jgi:hypothetical protein